MTSMLPPGGIGSVPFTPEPQPDDPADLVEPRRPAVPFRTLLAMGALALVGLALDGATGVVVGVAVVAVVLAGLPRRVIGLLGVASLVAAPIALLIHGIPSDASVTPAFVYESLWPHHFTFAGLALVGTWVFLDLGADLHATATAPAPASDDGPDPLGRLSRLGRYALVGALGVAALVVLVAVWST